jgi:protein tyrosine phosphatase (PTP) superfamily phosphohydrolase (DUF442 family)
MAKARKRRLRWALGLAVLTATPVLALLQYVGVFDGNIRVVEPGRVYRSAQLGGPRLRDCLRSRGIRSVINLRGYSATDPALREEATVCAQLGIVHRDVNLSAVHLPPPEELRKLMEAFDSLPRPILVHCMGGADRSGLAGTLYLTVYRGVPLDEAEASQLTWRYGHVSFGQAHPMDEFFALYRQTAKGRPLREWITGEYPKLYAELGRRRAAP